MNGCGANDDDCWYACYESGTSQAQGQYDAIAECADTKCGHTTTDAAFQTCLGQQCGGEYAACFPPANCPIQGGGCASGEACYPTTSGANDCFPSNGKALGATCADSDTTLDCGDGAICLDGGCQAFCGSEVHCGGAVCEKPVFSDVPNVGICGCVDNDRDGACAADDCNDQAASVYPGAAESCGDGVDNDCDGQTDEDCG